MAGRGTGAQMAAIVALLVGIVGVVGGLGYLTLAANAQYVPVDKETLCPLSGVVAQTVILLDTTDALAEVTRSDALNKLTDVTAGIPKGGLLDVRVLNEDPGHIQRVISLCNPGDGKGLDPLIANPEMARKRWNERFDGPVREVLRDSVIGQEQNASPILAAIQQIAAELVSSNRQKAIPTRVVVISDMLEHTGHYSHFRDGLAFETYLDIAAERYLTDLSNADIDFWMVQRNRRDLAPEDIAQFWLTWADRSHGKGKVTRLMGMDG